MKKVFKWIFIIGVVVILAIDIAGFWKYKLKTNNSNVATTAEPIQALEEQNNDIEYIELTSNDFKNGEKLFITDITSEEEGKYTVKGIIYEEYTVTKDEYNKIKKGTAVNIFDIEYTKDQIQSNNLKLKSTNENAYDLYITYSSKYKKYIVKDRTTDYSVYKSTDKYVKLVVDDDLDFVEEKNGKTNKTTVKDVEGSHKNLSEPENTIKVNISTLTFNKKGICTKITELYM